MSMTFSMFENDQCSISLDQVTWIEKKRDGAVNVHFPGSDVILMNKSYGPAFMEAFHRFHQWRSGQLRPQQPQSTAQRPASATPMPQQPQQPQQS